MYSPISTKNVLPVKNRQTWIDRQIDHEISVYAHDRDQKQKWGVLRTRGLSSIQC